MARLTAKERKTLEQLCFAPEALRYAESLRQMNLTFRDKFESTKTTYHHFRTQSQVDEYMGNEAAFQIFTGLIAFIAALTPQTAWIGPLLGIASAGG